MINSKKIISALDLDATNKTILNTVEERTIAFNKKRIRKALKDAKELRKIELNTNDDIVLTKEEQDEIKTNIINDQESITFKINEIKNLSIEKDNYLNLRKNIDGLNDMWYDSADIEKIKIQTIDNFNTYENIVILSTSYSSLFHNIKKKFLDLIETNIQQTPIPKRLETRDLSMESLALIIKLREMYMVDTDTDDFEIFDLYGMESNIEISHSLSDLFMLKFKSGKNNDNIINEFMVNQQSNSLVNINKMFKSNIVNNKMLSILFGNKHISNNETTTFENTYSNNVNLGFVYRTRTLGELLLEITNNDISEKSKVNRQQIYMTYDGTRPSKESYHKWNGLQVYDLDMKFWIKKSGGDIQRLKYEIHQMLCGFHWYLWICTSASGNGLHIYTKVSPPHHVYTKAQENEYISKYWHQVNYVTKLSVIYDILERLHYINGNGIIFSDFYRERAGIVTLEDNTINENKYVDNVVARITAGIRLAYDPNPLINNGFVDMHCGWALGQTIDGYEYQPTIESKILRISKHRTKIDETLVVIDSTKMVSHKPEIDLSKFVNLGGDITNIKPLHRNAINYNIRYNVCNTLASLFGKDGLQIAHTILDSKACNNIDEINSFYSCAISNGKEPSKYGLEILKKHGIIRSIEPELTEQVETTYKLQLKHQIEKSLANSALVTDYKLNSNQYLSDIKDKLFSENNGITGEKINVILSPAGSGKCLGKDTPILMYNGSIKKVQDLVVGDVLMGWDSKPRNILSTCTGQEELFNVIPNKGMSWVCNRSHILSLISTGKQIKFENIENYSIDEYLKLGYKKKHNLKIFRNSVTYENIENLRIDPYFLGLWLGDGTTTEAEVTISNTDYETINWLKNYANEINCSLSEYKSRDSIKVYRFIKSKNESSKEKSIMRKNLESYGLIGFKYIPRPYLLNSRENRLKLLAGLIDSDGGVSSGCYEYVTKLDPLKNDIIYLCRSLGFGISYTKKIDKRWKSGIKEYWRLIISGDFSEVPVLLPRKKLKNPNIKNPLFTGFKLESLGVGDYYGFEIDGDKMFMLGDFTVTHNTELIKQLAKDNKKILLVLPYVSVIQNKIETDSTVTELFDTFYGNADFKSIEYGRNIVTTFDKFSRANYDKISKMFDYIILDESHLLFTSSYRIEATSNVIKKIKELYYISSNDPFASKIILMTGTSTGEDHFFNKVANIIRVSKPSLAKEMEFLICGDTLDAITRLASKGAELLSNGYKLMIPTNKGEIYSEKIIGMIEYLIQRPLKYGYYKRSNTEQEICKMINENNTIGDYDIVFCSNYLSVGVDINDFEDLDGNRLKFASLYLGNFSGYEIEQFNARIRKTGIKSIYCLHTNTADGTTNEVLLSEPNLLLKITDEDQLFFIDDKSIASAKTEFIATYDPILHKIVTPGFSLFNGKIQFNLEEYELISFENKYNVCMEHPIKVARELARYGYTITVSTEFEGLSLGEQEILKKMGIEAAKQEKVRKHNLMVGTYVDLVKNNTYINKHGLEFNNVIEWIGKHNDKIIEDRELTIDITTPDGIVTEPCFVKVIFDLFAAPQQVIVRSIEALDKMYKPAKYLINRYSTVKALDIIYKYVDDSGVLKQKNFLRAINLLKLIDSSDANELADPIVKTLEKMYTFIDRFETSNDYRIGYESYQATIDSWVAEYIDMLGIKVNTKYGWEKIRNGIVEMMADLSTRQTSKNGMRFSYNRLPDQDSSNVLNRRSIDSIVSSMFNITETVTETKKQVRDKHVILTPQNF